MMKNKFWDKIKLFFKKIFKNKETMMYLNSGSKDSLGRESNNNFITQISMQEESIKKDKQEQIAQKLFNYELYPSDLTESETEEMTEWFTDDIEKMDLELEKIKNHIISMKKQLEQL